MGTPEFIRKLKANPDANREALAEFGRMGAEAKAQKDARKRDEDATFDEAFDASKADEVAKMSEERGDRLVPEEDK